VFCAICDLKVNSTRLFLLGICVISSLLLLFMPQLVEVPKPLFGQPVSRVSPKFLPILACTGILLFALAGAIRQCSPAVTVEAGQFRSLAWLVAIIVVAALAYEPAGYLLVSVLAAVTLTLVMGNRRIILFIVTCSLFCSTLYWLLTVALATYLPAGEFFQ
jgi:hypothetical protein